MVKLMPLTSTQSLYKITALGFSAKSTRESGCNRLQRSMQPDQLAV